MDVAPSRLGASVHTCHEEMEEELHSLFLGGWKFPSQEARVEFLRARMSRLFCFMFPAAKKPRIAFPCMLFTLLHLLEGSLDSTSPDAAQLLYGRLASIASGERMPVNSRFEELVIYNIFSSMRLVDEELSKPVLDEFCTYLRDKLSPHPPCRRTLGEYIQYQLGNIGTAYSTLMEKGASPAVDCRPSQHSHPTSLHANRCGGFHRLTAKMAAFVTDLDLETAERAAFLPIEENLGKHMLLLNDFYAFTDEFDPDDERNSEVRSAILCIIDETGLGRDAAKRLVMQMVRGYESKHEKLTEKLVTDLGATGIKRLRQPARRYLRALEAMAAGNEAWAVESAQKSEPESDSMAAIDASQVNSFATTVFGARSSSLQNQRARPGTEVGAGQPSGSQSSSSEGNDSDESEEVNGDDVDSGNEGNNGSPTPRKGPALLRIDTTASGSNFAAFDDSRSAIIRTGLQVRQPPRPSSSPGRSQMPVSRSLAHLPHGPGGITYLGNPRVSGPASMRPTAIPRATKGPGVHYAIPGTMTTGSAARKVSIPAQPMGRIPLPTRPDAAPPLLRSMSEFAIGRGRPAPQADPRLQGMSTTNPGRELSPDSGNSSRVLGTSIGGGLPAGLGITYVGGGGNFGAIGEGITQASAAGRWPEQGKPTGTTTSNLALPSMHAHRMAPAPIAIQNSTWSSFHTAPNSAPTLPVSPPSTLSSQPPLPRAMSTITMTRSLPMTYSSPLRPFSVVTDDDDPFSDGSSIKERFPQHALHHPHPQQRPRQHYQQHQLPQVQQQRGYSHSVSSSTSSPRLPLQHPSPAKQPHPAPTQQVPAPPPRSSSGVVVRDPQTGEIKTFAQPQRKTSLNPLRKLIGGGGGSAGSNSRSASRASKASSSKDSGPQGGKDSTEDARQDAPQSLREQKAAEMKEAVLQSIRKAGAGAGGKGKA